jgi:hypothetical protein
MEQTDNQASKPVEAVEQQPRPKKPNETGSISVEGFVRIFDPNTKEKFVEKRA